MAKPIVLILVFCALLGLPLAEQMTGFDPAPRPRSHRPRAPLPRLRLAPHALADFPPRFSAWFDQNFGMRNSLVRWHNRLKVQALGISPNRNVVVGAGGWLFLGRTLNAPPKGSERIAPGQPPPWFAEFQRRQQWLAARGIRYLVVVTCDKSSVYPEFLPFGKRPVRPDPRRDGLIARLQAETDVPLLDLRPPLLEAKPRQRLYLRTDMHWSDDGAQVGYRAILRRLAGWFPGMEPLPPSAFRPLARVGWSGGLARAVQLEGVFSEDTTRLLPVHPRARRARLVPPKPSPGGLMGPLALERRESALPRLVMLRDSFAGNLIPLLSEHFSRAVYLWQQNLDQAFIEREGPDLVIQQITDYHLLGAVPLSPF